MKRILAAILLSLALVATVVTTSQAAAGDITWSTNRSFTSSASLSGATTPLDFFVRVAGTDSDFRRVEFSIDGALFKTDANAPFQAHVTTTAGQHALQAVARRGKLTPLSFSASFTAGSVVPPTTTTPVPTSTSTPPPTTTSEPPTTTTTTTVEPTTTTTTAPPADCILTGADFNGAMIPAGETCQVIGTYEPAANVVVEGTLVMRAGSTMRFTGINEANYVGGGLVPIASDVGLWVVGAGRLDIQGTPKAGWNRTGDDPSWLSTDEIVSAPISGSTNFAPFVKGSTVPQADPRVPPTEVMNLTRDVRIEGTPSGRSHIFIHSTSPQVIKYAAIRYMGPTGVLGRYPIHFHLMGDGSRGSIIEGVVVRDVGNHAYAIHTSSGVTVSDSIAYNVLRDAYWYDGGDATDDLTYVHDIAAKVNSWDAAGGEDKYRLAGFRLGFGTGNSCIECVAVGVRGNTDSSAGFNWPENTVDSVWNFQNSVSHNNSTSGAFVWHNGGAIHPIVNLVSYRNSYGVSHGAYVNNYHYENLVLIGNGTAVYLHAEGQGSQVWSNTYIADSSLGFLGEGEPPVNGTPVVICNPTFVNVGTQYQLNGLDVDVRATCP